MCLFGFVKATKFTDSSEYSQCFQNVLAKSCPPCQVLYKQTNDCWARKSLGTSNTGFVSIRFPAKIAWAKSWQQETKVDYYLFTLSPICFQKVDETTFPNAFDISSCSWENPPHFISNFRQVCFAGCGLKFNYNWKAAGTKKKHTSGRLTVIVTWRRLRSLRKMASTLKYQTCRGDGRRVYSYGLILEWTIGFEKTSEISSEIAA